MNLQNINKVHFIGIGGIMMSALARYFLQLGAAVSGSDRDDSQILRALEQEGARVFVGHKENQVPADADLVVYTVAVHEDESNPEFDRARELGIPIKKVYEVIGSLTQKKYTIAVSGMHGKSTTTAMLALAMEQARLDPTVFIGTKIKEWDSNFRFGRSKYLLSEACEYKDNFLHYHPDVLVINNVEAEHLDYFKNIENILKSFGTLVGQIKKNGWLIANGDDENAMKVADKFTTNKLIFGIKNIKADVRAININMFENGSEFTLAVNNSQWAKHNGLKFSLQILGEFNVYNALGVITAGMALGLTIEQIKKSLESFQGVWRRFEFRGEKNGVEYYDDYAHHPTEIRVTLQAIKQKFGHRRVWLVFQPHLYSRTVDFFDRFVAVFGDTENLILAEIYPAREENKWGISSRDIADKINEKFNGRETPALYFRDFREVREYLQKNLESGDIVMTMGAGLAFQIGDELLKENQDIKTGRMKGKL